MRQLDVLFVEPNSSQASYQGLAEKYAAIETPTWSLLLAQACRAKGYGVAICDANAERLGHPKIADRVLALNPRLVCFVVYGQNPNSGTTNMSGAFMAAAFLKCLDPKIKICFVGSHTSALPKEVLAKSFVDFILLNEGVYALQNLLATDLVDVKNVKGIGHKVDGQPVLNPPERVVPNDRMDIDLPGYAWDLLPYKDKPFDLYRSHFWHAGFDHNHTSPFASLYTSLGCRFKCEFCLPGDTKIILSKDRNKLAKDIQEGDLLIGWNEEKSEMTEVKVIKTCSRKANQLYHIKLSDGKQIKCTAEHPLYVSGKWIKADELKVGDNLLVIEPSDKIKFRMANYNPSFNADSVKKSAETTKQKIASGEFVRYMCTDEGKKVIAAKAKIRALSSDNPMKQAKNRKAASERMQGDKNPSWAGGISTMFQQYPDEFSISLRKKIRKRDNRQCQECGKERCKLDVHHIDYNKHNNTECNLITLCASCHTKTNFNREKWTKKYKQQMLQYNNCPHYVTIESIVIEDGEFTVYNFECDKHNNYFANYILVHNCMINIVNRINNDDNISAANSNMMRFWSPEFIIKEFDKLQAYGVNTIRIVDEMFLLDKRYFEPLLNLLAERDYAKTMKSWIYSRVDTARPKFFEQVKKAGIQWLALGIESANTNIRREVTKGTFEEVNIRQVVKDIEDAGLYTIANYIFGLPDDDFASMQQTLDLALELNTETANMYPCQCLPGSPLYLQAKQNGWDLPTTFEGYSFLGYDAQPSRSKHCTAAEILKFRDEAWQQYFTNPAHLDKLERVFGLQQRKNVEELSKIKLKRKLLGD